MKRKVTTIILLVFCLLLAACNSAPASNKAENSEKPASNKESSESAAINIGALLTLSGSQAITGESAKKGIELYLSQHNNMVGDRKVTIKYEDDEGNPQTGLRKYRLLMDTNKSDVVVGPILSNVVYALRDEVEKTKKILMVITAAANDISWDKKSDYIFRTSLSNWQSGTPLGAYSVKNIGKKAFIVALDYPAGHEVATAFKDAFTAAGGEVIQEAYPALGKNDFAAFITQIQQAKPDFVYAFIPGADGIRFIQQYKQFGLQGQIPLTSSGEFSDVLVTEPTGADAEGIVSSIQYFPGLDNEINKKFVADYQSKYGALPNLYAVYGYDAMQALAEAVKKAGNVNSEDLKKALQGISFNSPRGVITLDPKTNNPIQTFYAGRNVMKDGKIVFEPIEKLGEFTMPAQDPHKK